MQAKPCGNCVEDEAHQGHSKPEYSNVSQVLKEFSSSHVVARVENDGRQEKVEEDCFGEPKYLNVLYALAVPEYYTEDNTTKDYEACLMPTARLVLLHNSSSEEEN